MSLTLTGDGQILLAGAHVAAVGGGRHQHKTHKLRNVGRFDLLSRRHVGKEQPIKTGVASRMTFIYEYT